MSMGACDSLRDHYIINFALMQHHKYQLGELESMLPWERDIYVGLLKNHLAEQKEKRGQ